MGRTCAMGVRSLDAAQPSHADFARSHFGAKAWNPVPQIAGAFTKEERESPQTYPGGMPDWIIRSIGSCSVKFWVRPVGTLRLPLRMRQAELLAPLPFRELFKAAKDNLRSHSRQCDSVDPLSRVYLFEWSWADGWLDQDDGGSSAAGGSCCDHPDRGDCHGTCAAWA